MKNKNNFLCIFILLGFFIVMLDSTIVNVSINEIGNSLHIDKNQLHLIINIYTLSLASSLLSWGNISDTYGAFKTYLLGLFIFGISSLSCGLSLNYYTLILARLFQGIGGGCLIPTSLTLLSQISRDDKERSKFIGLWGCFGGLAAATGPILGGTITQHLNWNSIFFINIPIVIVVIVVILLNMKNYKIQNKKHENKFSWKSCILITTIMTLITLIFMLYTYGMKVLVILCFALFIVIQIFILHEKKIATPLFLPYLIKSRKFIISNFIGFCLNFSFFGELFVFSLFLQNNLLMDVQRAGLSLFPQTCSAIIAAPLGGKCTSILGNKKTIQIGLSIGTIGFLLLNVIDKNVPFYITAIFSFIASFGMAFSMPATTNQAVSVAKKEEQGLASGIINTSRQFGSVIGVVVIGNLFNSLNVHYSFTLAGLMFLIALVIISIFDN